jgi:DNA-binding response OmpR family regulator/chromosome segregation ATPase
VACFLLFTQSRIYASCNLEKKRGRVPSRSDRSRSVFHLQFSFSSLPGAHVAELKMSEADQKPPTQADGKVGAEPSTGRKQILLAERDGFTRVRLLTWLRTAGLDGHFATNGIQALNKIRNERPDALLVELGLGGLNSLELIRAARSHAGFGSRPIFVYTSTEQLTKNTRQKVRLLATRVFEKDSTSEFDLSKFLTAALLNPDDESADLGGTVPAAVGELILPEEMGEMLADLDERRRSFARRVKGKARVRHCEEFLVQVCSLASCAEFIGARNLARHANALAALLKEVGREEATPSESAPATVSRAVEVVRLLTTAPAGRSRNLWKFDAVIIDQASTSRAAISDALREIGFDPIAFEDPAAGRDHLMSKAADVVIMNVVPAEQHGLTQAEVRQMPLQAATPVIFPYELSAKVNKAKGRSPDAPQLNANLLLLKELIMKALNEVLSAHASGHQRPAAAAQPQAPAANPVAAPASEPAVHSIAAQDNLAGQPTPEQITPIQTAEEIQAIDSAAQNAPEEIPAVIFQKAPAPVPAPAPVVETSYEMVEGKKTVLFIEDDPFVLKIYTRCLRRGGLHVEVASDGMEALEALPRVRPDIVVLDLLLPKLHGLEVLKFIRADVNLKGTPVLVLSNAYVEDLAVKAQQAGANRGILKTECTPMKLLEIVWEMLGRAMFVPAQAAPPEQQQIQAPPVDNAPQTETAIWVRQADLLQDVPKEVSEIRRACLGYIKSVGAEDKMACLHELYRRVRFLGARAGLCGFEKIAELCNPFEGLLFQILYNQTSATPSTFNTIAQTVDCLDRFSQSHDSKSLETKTKARVLVVDDDAVCNFSMVNALKRASFEVEGVLDPVESLSVLESNSFDMILLDINMPRLTGFEVCERLRKMPQYKSVPVVFVTLDSDFQNRARGILAGGNDVLIKPVFALELILKVTMHLLKSASPDSPEGLAPGNVAIVAVPVESLRESRISQVPVEQLSARELTPSETQATWASSAGTESEQLQQTADALAAALLQQLSSGQPASAVEAQANPEPWQNRAEPISARQESPDDSQSWAGDIQQQETSPAEPAGAENRNEAQQSAAGFESPLVGQIPGQELALRLQALEEECANHREAAGQYQQERETLVARIYSAETNLHHANTQVERGAETIAKLQGQLEELSQAKAQSATNLAEQAEEEALPVPGGPDPLVVAAKNAAKDALKARQKTEEKCDQLERELAESRQARAELQAWFEKEQMSAAESGKRVQELEVSLNQSSAEMERQAVERTQAEGELRRQLESIGAVVQQREKEKGQAQAHCARLQSQLEGMSTTRQDLERQLGQASTELQQQAKDFEGTKAGLIEKLEAAAASVQQREAALSKSELRCAGLEKDLAGLSQTRDELGRQFAKEQQVTAESTKRIHDLEQRLSQSAVELETRAMERGLAEAHWRQQLEAAVVSAKQADSTREKTEVRCAELQQELAELRRSREELAIQKQAAAESNKRIQDLEQRLDLSSTESEKQGKEHDRVESDLRKQLEQATAAAHQRETAQKQVEGRCIGLEKELAELRQTRDDLNVKLTRDQQATVESNKQIKELQQRRAELETLVEGKGRVEADLRKQLESASVSSQQLEATRKQAETRCAELEKELTGLRNSREELAGQFSREQQDSAESGKRVKELELQLDQHAAEQKKQFTEHGRAELELRKQLEVASASVQQHEATRKQADLRCAELEKELAGLRKTGEELTGQFTKEQLAASEQQKRFHELEQRHAKLEAQFEKQSKQHGRAELDLRQELESASASVRRAEESQKQARTRSAQLEQELIAVDKARQELDGQLAEKQKVAAEFSLQVKELEQRLRLAAAELERGKAESESKARDRDHAESVLRLQVETATASVLRMETAQKASQNRCALLEQELDGLRKEREGLSSQVVKEQQVGLESGKRVRELEDHLQHSTAELAKWKEEHGYAETDLRRRLEIAGASLQQSETAHKQSQLRCSQLEQELTALSAGRQELNGRLEKEQQVAAESQKQVQELEQRLIQSTSELESRKAELEKRTSEHGAAESELRRQVDLANAAVQQGEMARNQTEARCAQLEQELAAWRKTREELEGQLAVGRQALTESTARVQELEKQVQLVQADGTAHIDELDQRVRQGVSALARAMSDLAKERGERQRSEQNAATLSTRLQGLHAECGKALQAQQAAVEQLGHVEARFQQREQALATLTANVEQERTARLLAEEQLQSERQLSDQLRKDLTVFDEARGVFDRTRQELQSKLEAALTNQQQIDSRLREESAEGKRLVESLDSAQRQVQDQARIRESLESQLQTSTESLQASELKLQQAAAERVRMTDALEGIQRELRHESQNRQTLEAQLKTSAESLRSNEAKLRETACERQRLTESLNDVQHQLQTATRKSEALGAKLCSAEESLQANEAKLREISADRQRLAAALETARLAMGDLAQRHELESSNHQTALHLEQVDRKRQETNIARMRQASLDSLRAARVVRNGLRQQIREPVDSLCQSASSLLESQLAEQQKALAEAVLQQALMVRARLQDPDPEKLQSVAGPGTEQGQVASSLL